MNHKPKEHPYLKIEELLSFIDEPERSKCLKLLNDNRELFEWARGSSNNHQAWKGGYINHITDAMNIGFYLYDHLSTLRKLTFSKSDMLLVIFVHDLEKPWKYKSFENENDEYKEYFIDQKKQHEFRLLKLKEYGIQLNDEQENGVLYIEGEKDDYTNKKRTMKPLAAFCHMCDIASARIWFDYPRSQDDTWATR